MGTGFTDFVDKPQQGYRDGGGKEALYGVAIGTGSLLKNTIEGSFGFMQSLSEGFSKGVLLLS